jgi:N-acetylglucosaminyldiphosphoundecaprenol N-acetyl-beta-D-mannosaminyltransferase
MIATVDVLGTELHDLTMDAATAQVVALARSDRPHLVVTANVDHLMGLRRDAEFRQAYDQASLRLADGAPVVALARLCGTPLPERVTGADLMPAVLAAAEESGLRVFMLGGTPEVAADAARAIRSRYPRLVMDHASPPWHFEEDEREDRRTLGAVRAFRPDVVFVCVGAPRSEKWVARHLVQLDHGVVLCVGAAVDFVAGAKRRAPVAVQRLGLEWAFRLAQEPGRLWRRYLVTDSQFVLIAARHLGIRWARRRLSLLPR